MSSPHPPHRTAFDQRYGPWALVAGGSMGIGAEYARQLAARGLNLLLVAESPHPLERLALELEQRHRVTVRPLVADLGHADALERVGDAASDVEVGLLVCNAASAPVGPFLSLLLEDKLRVLDVNCRAPLYLIHSFAPAMVARGRGGIVMMSSLAGLQGTALVTAYSASKAFDLALGEGLWDELRGSGVDVLALCAGETRTELYEATTPRSSRLRPPVMEPEEVVREALAALGQGPGHTAGRWNRITAALLRGLPRNLAVRIMGRAMRQVYPHRAGR